VEPRCIGGHDQTCTREFSSRQTSFRVTVKKRKIDSTFYGLQVLIEIPPSSLQSQNLRLFNTFAETLEVVLAALSLDQGISRHNAEAGTRHEG